MDQGYTSSEMAVMTYLPQAVSPNLDRSSGTEAELVGPKLERVHVEAEAVRGSQRDGHCDELGTELSCNGRRGTKSCSGGIVLSAVAGVSDTVVSFLRQNAAVGESSSPGSSPNFVY